MTRETPSVAVLPGDPRVEVQLRRSGRARRYSLRVSQLDGRVTLTLPTQAPLREGLDFLNERAEWVRGHLEQRPEAQSAVLGGELLFEGVLLPVRGASGLRAPRIEGGALLVPDNDARASARIQAFLKQAARDRLVAACDRHAAALGRRYGRITLRDTRSRWGSCTAQGDLMFSWRLIMAPPVVLDYVAAHEVAHLIEMNHSAAFWAQVARVCPDYARHRGWLRENGRQLHQVRFE
ncbi:M48 family metallopeptidase [Actibacterium sp. XHP0104]|uniref:M48 family metallopeptidase n=1 Tax=Actibacterium sp. XHP0104 TaxID=2984335 RepID=UPI0021E99030|nr:SprT family zinc-dependent metalloprotease [Actibacterium sp. XHP0104]MCV2882627.1 M48 family metallopeptidase [Actibacterium sp. XHP0104]